MSLAFGWNAYLQGMTIDWKLAAQSTAFVYLGADAAFLQAQADAQAAKLLVGGYWSLSSDIDPAGQVELFLSRIGKVKPSDLPPAVWVYRAAQLPTLKVFVEKLEKATGRRTLIGGTPQSLKDAGALFGRTNPLWLSFTPSRWSNPTPQGWERISISQPTAAGEVKGVSGKVGLNYADPSFLDINKGAKLALGFGALFLIGAGLYFYAQGNE